MLRSPVFTVSFSAVALFAMASPAQAAVTVTSCTPAQLANAVGAVACNYVIGNATSNSAANRLEQQAAIGALSATTFVYNYGTNASNSFKDGVNLGSLSQANNPINFGTPMFVETIVGIHFGKGADGPFDVGGNGGVTAFYRFVFNAQTSAITLGNSKTLSNAHLYATGSVVAVPEPATWALLIFGFGIVGAGMRRRPTTTVAFAG